MDRGRRAEPYSNATIWTREIARNLAGHLSRVSKAHSCVDTKSPISTRLPKFHHQKRCPTSPSKTRQPFMAIPQLSDDQKLHFKGADGAREETDSVASSVHTNSLQNYYGEQTFDARDPQLEDHRAVTSHEANQEVSDAQVRIPAVKPPTRHHTRNGNASGDMTYDSPPVLLHQRHHVAHDYYKRQEQRKIWQENQALNKRLQSAKTTLNFKEWEKSDKWTQEFLKNQEKRRVALQQELRRAQISPQAVLRSRPLKSLHHRPMKSAALGIEDVSGALSAPSLIHRGSKGQILVGSRGGSGAIVQRSSASNHRRVKELRRQKQSPLRSTTCVAPSTDVNAVACADQSSYIPDNEIVTVRFTFSRGRSRGADRNSNDSEQTDEPKSLELDDSDRDTMSLSGAFSPGLELESVLNAVGDKVSDRHRNISSEAAVDAADEGTYYRNDSQDSVATKGGDTAPANGEADPPQVLKPEEESREDESSTAGSAAKDPVQTEESNGTPPEENRTLSDEEEDYDGDYFDDDGLLSPPAREEQHDNLDTSGYSEFDHDE